MSLRPPSTSPSPSPAPENGHNKLSSRQSLGPGPATRGAPALAPGSPRLAGGGTRPTSELVGSAGLYQTPEGELIVPLVRHQFLNERQLRPSTNGLRTSKITKQPSKTWRQPRSTSTSKRSSVPSSNGSKFFQKQSAQPLFTVFSNIRHKFRFVFFITVLQQMARSDPMTALLSPAVGGSMQQQMEAKLASLKSPGLKSGLPASPTARNFNQATPGNRQSLIETPNNYLSPDSASLGQSVDAASTLAQQRAKLKASNVAHRISAPIMSSTGDRNTWGASGLSQVAESNRAPSPTTPGAEDKGSRPKSAEFINRPAPVQEATVPAHASSESWASMVTTPAMQMFAKTEPKEAPKVAEWKSPSAAAAAPGVPRMGDPTIHRRGARPPQQQDDMYDDNGNFVPRGNMGRPGWQGATSPASNRFGSSDDGRGSNNGRGNTPNMGMNGMGGFGMGGMNSAGAMGGMNPFGVNMNMLAMGISPETQLLAAQMAQAQIAAAGGAFGMGGMGGIAGAPWLAGPHSAGMGGRMMRPPNSARTPRSATSNTSGMGINTPKGEDDVDPALLNDVPAWLRSLRLHKYTPNFEGMRWQDMVIMDEPALEAKGVAALGARRKMLKTFEIVRKKMGIEGGPPMTTV
ncbi:SAM domain-containing protein [Mycena indigotica]|uniref:RNA-binding protein VTS1 n=1 Tax=Mycena indigotica TaxID=2126181 RepID=A0A8H6SIH9_9AGAR|nr:SAM domain-containing protein [Mycena indigotica]KAF7299467.1 SAM domain-containing protein [Mycena indigotica]